MIINVLKTGSYCLHTEYNGRSVFIVRNHIVIPNTPIQKWSSQYLYLKDFNRSLVDLLCNNHNQKYYVSVSASIESDKNENVIIKAVPISRTSSDIWITTVTGIDYSMRKTSLIPINANGISQIFSVAYNKANPEMFEATLILQKGDIVKMGKYTSVFCPIENPFLNVRCL